MSSPTEWHFRGNPEQVRHLSACDEDRLDSAGRTPPLPERRPGQVPLSPFGIQPTRGAFSSLYKIALVSWGKGDQIKELEKGLRLYELLLPILVDQLQGSFRSSCEDLDISRI